MLAEDEKTIATRVSLPLARAEGSGSSSGVEEGQLEEKGLWLK